MKTKLWIATVLISQSAWALIDIRSANTAGKVEFEAVGKPSMIKIKGTGEGVTSSLKINNGKISGVVAFRLDSLKTGIDLRDEHMKEKYLHVKQHPEARLVITEQSLPTGWSLQQPALNGAAFKAVMVLHGVQQEVTGTYSVESPLKVNANFEIKLSDFKIDIPSYLGVKVADVVKVSVAIDRMSAKN